MAIKSKSNFWKDRNVFITGGTGLLGSWLIKYLLDNQARVIGLIRDEVPDSNLHRMGLNDRIVKISGDVENYLLIKRIMNEYEVETVIHLAAQTIVSVANRDPLSTFEANIKGTWNILEAARQEKNIKQVIVSSSDKAYGDKDKLPYEEDEELKGRHPYDVSKSCADLISQSYFTTYKLPVCVTRCANLYGGGDLNFSRIIPGTIRSAINNETPIIRSDGKYLRDYFYVEDAVLAFLNLAENMQDPKIHGEAFNFSSGVHVNVIELVEKILKLMHKDLKPKILNEARNEIRNQYLSIEKAKSVLKWKSKFELDDGLKNTIDWYEDYLGNS